MGQQEIGASARPMKKLESPGDSDRSVLKVLFEELPFAISIVVLSIDTDLAAYPVKFTPLIPYKRVDAKSPVGTLPILHVHRYEGTAKKAMIVDPFTEPAPFKTVFDIKVPHRKRLVGMDYPTRTCIYSQPLSQLVGGHELEHLKAGVFPVDGLPGVEHVTDIFIP
jgi:hypothetical protein